MTQEEKDTLKKGILRRQLQMILMRKERSSLLKERSHLLKGLPRDMFYELRYFPQKCILKERRSLTTKSGYVKEKLQTIKMDSEEWRH